jgi:hypothetical protein
MGGCTLDSAIGPTIVYRLLCQHLWREAGFIYQMYGFGLLRGMELHQEAGFNPIRVILIMRLH